MKNTLPLCAITLFAAFATDTDTRHNADSIADGDDLTCHRSGERRRWKLKSEVSSEQV